MITASLHCCVSNVVFGLVPSVTMPMSRNTVISFAKVSLSGRSMHILLPSCESVAQKKPPLFLVSFLGALP